MEYKGITYTQAEYDHTWDILKDMVPYNDPNYNDKVHEMVLSAILQEKKPDPELEELCRIHDEMLERGEIDH